MVFNFGQTSNASTGFNFGSTAPTNTGLGVSQSTASTGFSFGTTTPAAGGGISLGGAATTPSTSLFGNNNAASTGFGISGFGANKVAATTAATTGLGGFGAAATPSSGFGGFGTAATVNSGFGSGLGGAATTATSSFGFGNTLGGSQTTASSAVGFGTGLTAPSSGIFGGLGGNVGAVKPNNSTALGGTGIGLGGFGAPSTTSSAVSSSGFSSNSSSNVDSKPGGKAVKEGTMPPEIATTVEQFKKCVADQKIIREEITRVSSKQMFKIKEEVTSLKHLLSLVQNGLERNATSVGKLKLESMTELKYAEIAQRTKDTPPGLQYENTAPNKYFGELVEDFELRMISFKQQIDEMDTLLASMKQPYIVTPDELSQLLRNLNESFIYIAAQLQAVHEVAQTQKDQYLNYRKIFHNDNTDIFEARKKHAEKSKEGAIVTVGYSLFSGMSNIAASAMASALKTQTNTVNSNGMPANGTANPYGGFGTTNNLLSNTSAFGLTNKPSTFGFGSTTGSNLGGFGQPQSSFTSTSAFGSPQNTFGNTSTFGQANGFGQTSDIKLQNPPAGNKRGKKA